MSTNKHLSANQPLWSGDTKTVAIVSPGVGPFSVPLTIAPVSGGVTRQATSAIVSNTGPVNVHIASSVGATTGVLLQPGAAITLGLGNGASIFAIDAVGTATLAVVLF